MCAAQLPRGIEQQIYRAAESKYLPHYLLTRRTGLGKESSFCAQGIKHAHRFFPLRTETTTTTTTVSYSPCRSPPPRRYMTFTASTRKGTGTFAVCSGVPLPIIPRRRQFICLTLYCVCFVTLYVVVSLESRVWHRRELTNRSIPRFIPLLSRLATVKFLLQIFSTRITREINYFLLYE